MRKPTLISLGFAGLVSMAYHEEKSTTFALSLSMSGNGRKIQHDASKSIVIPSENTHTGTGTGTGTGISSRISRRDALISTSATLAGILGSPFPSNAELPKAETVDLEAIKAAQSRTASIPGTSSSVVGAKTVIPIQDPNPLLSIRGGLKGKGTVKIPRVGYSFYKTSPDLAGRCTALALRAGVRHFDLGTLYGSNQEITIPLKQYLDVGMSGLGSYYSMEKPEVLSFLDGVKADGDQHALATASSGLLSAAAPAPDGSAGRRGRREGLFISHKLSNEEQSMHRIDVKRAVQAQIKTLGVQYLDMVSIHSPLTDRSRRLETYAALLELRDGGFVKSVGVCNYGVGALKEIKEYGLELPCMNQLELSPFNTHSDVVEWCRDNSIAIGCGAWSKLSGVDGPQDQWAIVSKLAEKKNMTKAQVLARWSLQKGYVCVPRSGAGSKIERLAIGENSYGGINREGGGCVLTNEEMDVLDGLNIDYKAGKLGRRDGWGDSDVQGVDWDPTDFL